MKHRVLFPKKDKSIKKCRLLQFLFDALRVNIIIISGCDENEFLTWNTHGKCFTHTRDTAPKRQWLWDTCNVPGREVSAIFLSGFHHILQDAYDSKDCNTSGIQMVRKALTEGHAQVKESELFSVRNPKPRK